MYLDFTTVNYPAGASFRQLDVSRDIISCPDRTASDRKTNDFWSGMSRLHRGSLTFGVHTTDISRHDMSSPRDRSPDIVVKTFQNSSEGIPLDRAEVALVRSPTTSRNSQITAGEFHFVK